MLSATEIIDLDLSDNGLSDQSMECICDLQQKSSNYRLLIQKLNLSNNMINAAGLENLLSTLSFSNFLSQLNLLGNNFYLGGVQHFERFFEVNNSIAHLNLSGCSINHTYIISFCNGLSKNYSLKSLLLNNNSLRDQGCIALAECLKTNRVIETLNLERNQISNPGVKELAAALVDRNVPLHLNLAHNLFGDESTYQLIQAIDVNLNILSVNLDKNLIKHDYIKKVQSQIAHNRLIAESRKIPALQQQLQSYTKFDLTIDDVNDQKKQIALQEGVFKVHIADLQEKIKKAVAKLERSELELSQKLDGYVAQF